MVDCNDKILYPTEREARAAIHRMGRRLTPYHCKRHDGWHLSHIRESRTPKRGDPLCRDWPLTTETR